MKILFIIFKLTALAFKGKLAEYKEDFETEGKIGDEMIKLINEWERIKGAKIC